MVKLRNPENSPIIRQDISDGATSLLWTGHCRSGIFWSRSDGRRESRILMACPGKITRYFGTLNCPEFQTLSRFCSTMNVCCSWPFWWPSTYSEFVIVIRAQNAPNPFSAGAHWGAYDSPPDPLVGWGGNTSYISPRTVLRISIIDLWPP